MHKTEKKNQKHFFGQNSATERSDADLFQSTEQAARLPGFSGPVKYVKAACRAVAPTA